LASVLRVHGRAMSGGLLDAVERSTRADLEAGEAGFRWLGLDEAGAVVAMVRREIKTGALDDDDRAEALEGRADEEYGAVVPNDQALNDAFQARFAEEPPAFAPV
jgi:hypothetical protein